MEILKKTFLVVFVLISTVALLTADFPLGFAQPENTWESKAPMLTARSGFGLAVVNGKIYAIGGYNKNQTGFSDVNEMYDPATDTWTVKTPMPTQRVSFAIAVYKDKVYVFGGQILQAGRRVVINVTEVYDPASDSWTTKTSMPHLGEDFAANVVVEDKIYVISTYNDVYEPATDTWTTKTAIPEPVAHSANSVLDNKIYVMSGTHYGNEPQYYVPINSTQIYDPKTDTWSSGAPILTGIASPAAVSTTGVSAPKAIYVVGGLTLTEDQNGGFIYHPQKLIQVYSPENDSWSLGAPMPTARYALAVAELNDTLYAMGGSDARTAPDLASNELYFPLGFGSIRSQGVPLATIIGAVTVIVVVGAIIAITVLIHKRRNGKT